MLDFNQKNKAKSAVSTECKGVYNLSYTAVGSESDSGLVQFYTSAEINNEIFSTAPASIQFPPTIGPPTKRNSDVIMLAGL